MIEVIEAETVDETDSLEKMISALENLRDETLVLDGHAISELAEAFLTWGIVFSKSVTSINEVKDFVEEAWEGAPECDWVPIEEC